MMRGNFPDVPPAELAEAEPLASSCRSCGACCAYSREWPRFSTDPDERIDRLPPDLVSPSGAGMRCEGERCSALVGEIGVATGCSVYADRPDVCRACLPGDDACTMARTKFGMAPIEPR